MLEAAHLKLAALLLTFTFIISAESKIPSYIHVCKRNDPKIEQCITNSVHSLRSKLAKGIPEFEVPSIEPLKLPKVVVSNSKGFFATATNLIVHGASKYQIKKLKADVGKLEFHIDVFFPKLNFDGIFELDAKIIVPIKGKGPMRINTTNIDSTNVLKGHTFKKGGKTYLTFDSFVSKFQVKNFNVKLDRLFSGDKTLAEVINGVVNENKQAIMDVVLPKTEAAVSKIIFDIANKITKHFEYDELFPPK